MFPSEGAVSDEQTSGRETAHEHEDGLGMWKRTTTLVKYKGPLATLSVFIFKGSQVGSEDPRYFSFSSSNFLHFSAQMILTITCQNLVTCVDTQSTQHLTVLGPLSLRPQRSLKMLPLLVEIRVFHLLSPPPGSGPVCRGASGSAAGVEPGRYPAV